jgi:anthranilate phosphoribosyltransferase
VVAGAGIPVAKHGNRAATSSSGSADVLQHLGIDADVTPAQAEVNLKKHGICFMFAPQHHSRSPTLARARKRVGRPTIFNCLGPLCNPASAQHQLIGVWDERLRTSMARVLYRLGTKRSWIVNSIGTLDEIGLDGTTRVVEISEDGIETVEVTADDFGISREGEIPHDLGPAESAALINGILSNEKKDSAPERLVLVNAAAAIFISGRAIGLLAAYEEAATSIRTGAALEKLNTLRGKRK